MLKNKSTQIILLISFILIIYTVLTSSIMNVRSEIQVSETLISSVLNWSAHVHNDRKEVISREQKLSKEIDPRFVDKMKGKILLQVGSRGESYYVNPDDRKRYYLGASLAGYKLFKSFSLVLADEELMEYLYIEKKFPDEFDGRIVRGLDNKEKYYYIHPDINESHEFSRPKELREVIETVALGIDNKHLRMIEVADSE